MCTSGLIPDHRRWTNVDRLLVHRLRRWPNSKSTLFQQLVSAGIFGGLYSTLNNIGSLKRALQYHYHATPGELCKGSPGIAW